MHCYQKLCTFPLRIRLLKVSWKSLTAIIAILCFLYNFCHQGKCRQSHVDNDWGWKISPCPTRLFNQGHLESATQLSVQTSFEYLQDGDPITSLGNQCQCLVTLHKEGHPVILKAEVATIRLCICQASDSETRPFKHCEISHATSTPATNPL